MAVAAEQNMISYRKHDKVKNDRQIKDRHDPEESPDEKESVGIFPVYFLPLIV